MGKRESTLLKIEMASEAIKKENTRRKKLNKKARKDFEKRGKEGRLLRIFSPAAVPTARRTPKNMGRVMSMYSIVRSNKYLCGELSALCQVLRMAGLPYPWLDGEVA
jgi:hypothetical protein